jgi:hypothetical protein
MRLMASKITLSGIVQVSIIGCLFSGSLAWSKAPSQPPSPNCKWLAGHVRVGDLLFIEIKSELFKKVARASGGWTSHVGILARNSRGDMVVYESTLPKSKETPLCEFLGRSESERFELRRPHQSLSPSDEIRIGFEARRRLGVDYDLGFNWSSKKQFCSKFVRQIYSQVLGIELGEFESFGQLMKRLEGNPFEKEDLLFWRLYFLGHIPLKRITVSPHTQLIDPEFFTALEHHPGE